MVVFFTPPHERTALVDAMPAAEAENDAAPGVVQWDDAFPHILNDAARSLAYDRPADAAHPPTQEEMRAAGLLAAKRFVLAGVAFPRQWEWSSHNRWTKKLLPRYEYFRATRQAEVAGEVAGAAHSLAATAPGRTEKSPPAAPAEERPPRPRIDAAQTARRFEYALYEDVLSDADVNALHNALCGVHNNTWRPVVGDVLWAHPESPWSTATDISTSSAGHVRARDVLVDEDADVHAPFRFQKCLNDETLERRVCERLSHFLPKDRVFPPSGEICYAMRNDPVSDEHVVRPLATAETHYAFPAGTRRISVLLALDEDVYIGLGDCQSEAPWTVFRTIRVPQGCAIVLSNDVPYTAMRDYCGTERCLRLHVFVGLDGCAAEDVQPPSADVYWASREPARAPVSGERGRKRGAQSDL